MTPDELKEIQQKQLDDNLAAKWPHTNIVIFEDESVFITDENYQILSHSHPPPSDPNQSMDRAKWYSSSPT